VLPGDAAGKPGVILQALGPGEHVDRARLLDRFAGVAGFKFREFIIALAQQPRGTQEDPAALRTGQFHQHIRVRPAHCQAGLRCR